MSTVVFTGPRSAVGNVSGYRCEADCRSRGREFDPGPVKKEQEGKGRRRRLGEEEQAAMISKFALILLIFNNILIQSISNLHV